MGLADRDYNRVTYRGYGRPGSRGSFGGLRMLSVSTWLILICVVVFILDQLIQPRWIVEGHPIVNVFGEPMRYHLIGTWGFFSVDKAIIHLQLWRFITFQFLHAGTTHIVVNMIILFIFGPMIERYLGSARYLVFYLLCGIAGGATYVLLWMSHILVTSSTVQLVGASAGIFGVLVAAALIAPGTTILSYDIDPFRLRLFALVLLMVAALTVIFQGNNAGGEAAHLGGA